MRDRSRERGGGGASPPFAELLRGLSAVYESQQARIKELRDENEALQAGSFGKLLGTENVQPKVLDENLEDTLHQSQAESGTSPRSPASSSTRFPRSAYKGQADCDACTLGADSVDSPEGRKRPPCLAQLRQSNTNCSLVSSVRSSVIIPDMWPEWTTNSEVSLRIFSKSAMPTPSSGQFTIEDLTGEALSITGKCHQRLIISPNSPYRLCWDFLSALMVVYDLVTIPLMVMQWEDTDVFGGHVGPSSRFMYVMDWVTIIFWSVDMPWSFQTGYHADGMVEMRAPRVAKQYLKQWFLFDLFVLVIEWLNIYAVNNRSSTLLGFLRFGKTARLLRIARTVRLLRFVKLHRMVSECLEMLNSSSARAMFSIALTFSFVLAFSHYLACGFYLTGYVGQRLQLPNWLDKNGVREKPYAYATALHWSLSQFTPASMEVHPENLIERVYTILCLSVALVAFSSFLGSITASITELRNSSKDASQQEFVLRTYLARNNVSYRLSQKIWRFLKQNHFKHQRRSCKAIPTLKLLPPHLHNALYQELYGPYITRCPFFYQYTAFCREGLVDVCTKGITEQSLMRGESLFIEGRVAEKMFFMASGYMHYDHMNPRYNQTIGTGAWMSEAVLWVRWAHMATLYANTSCDIIELDSEKFRTVISVFKRSFGFVKTYAQLFHEHLLGCGTAHMSDLMTDVRGLQGVVRLAWHEVASNSDKDLFKEMPNLDFPRAGSQVFTNKLWRYTKGRAG